MKKAITVFLFSLFLFTLSFGQKKIRQTISLPPEFFLEIAKSNNITKYETTLDIPFQASPFLAFSVSWQTPENISRSPEIICEFSNPKKVTRVIILKEDEHANAKSSNQHVSQLMFIEPEMKKITLSVALREADLKNITQNIELHFYNPGISPVTPSQVTYSRKTNTCPCPQPPYLDRDGWCPDGNCPEHPNPEFTEVTHIIIHHSAGANVSSDWAAVVRSIWDYHVNSNGWSDIGYNWLIDPNGVIYEGRGDNIIGAHFCGKNSGTAGICMLGDFTNTTPTTTALSYLQKLISWKTCESGIDPLGAEFHAASNMILENISGHRDACTTSCPGDQFYPMLPAVRLGVKNFQENNCQELAAPTNLTAQVISENTVGLQWMDNSTTEDAFVLERSKNNNTNYAEIATLDANTETFTDTGLQPYTAYFYRVKAVEGQFSSAYSNEYGIATILTKTDEISIASTKVEIFPNPVSGPFDLQLNGAYKGEVLVDIFDARGVKKIGTFSFSKKAATQNQRLDISDLPAGVYFLLIQMGKQKGTMKVVRM